MLLKNTKFAFQTNKKSINRENLPNQSNQKYPNEAYLVPNSKPFRLTWNFTIDKFESADFKYENSNYQWFSLGLSPGKFLF